MGNTDSKAPGRSETDDTVATVTPPLSSKDESHFGKGTTSGAGVSSYEAGDEKKELEGDKETPRSNSNTAARSAGRSKKNRKSSVQARDDDQHEVASSHISDDQVHVNLAMADLMAYLQVVANNSNNLPLTRRDDPELGRPVSSLTSEEYARKSAAFLPSDVRVIGATFTRYGRVLDLPTAEEYNACDGALEPGRSYGGACCNSMLKVLYDAANDAADAAQTQKASEALFDDDDEDDEEASAMGKSFKSGFSLEAVSPNPGTITWADLLRKMKAEMKEIQYAQVPKITSTRKVDLNKPFSLVPDNFDAVKGKKRSLLIGCNYNNVNGAELKACHDDIRSMKDYIVNVHGFPETKGLMTVLLDNDDHKHPTFLNITEAFKALSEESLPGDSVFVQFSGHGGRILYDQTESEEQTYDEVIVPSDYSVSGMIRDTLIFKTLLAPMRYGVTVTIMVDCCDNGMVMDLPYSWTARNERKESLAKLSMNEDFSFVRFLKVVKTLYETSTFTQLGKTVGSALTPAPPSTPKRLKAKKAEAAGEATVDVSNPNTLSIFDVIDKACHITQSSKNSASHRNGTVSKRHTIPSQSLLDQVMSCTLASPGDDEDSDDDDVTYNTRTYDEHSFDTEGMSYESIASVTVATEDDESRKQSRRRRRR